MGEFHLVQAEFSPSYGGSDQFLIADAQEGSRTAFDTLHIPYSRSIYRVALSITRNHCDAEDAIQDALLRAYISIKQFRGGSQFSSWLTRIVINSSLGLLRKRHRRRETNIETTDKDGIALSVLDLIDPRNDPDQNFRTNQLENHLESSLDMLPLSLRRVARLKFVEEQSVEEISTTLCLSVSATKSRLYRARKLISLMDSELIRTLR